jgi:hypothetical protein
MVVTTQTYLFLYPYDIDTVRGIFVVEHTGTPSLKFFLRIMGARTVFQSLFFLALI